MRIMVGGMLQESNTFSPASSTAVDFKRHYYVVGDEMNRPLMLANELYGFYQAIAAHQATPVPTLYTNAVSSGRISRKALDELKKELLKQVERALPCDGILFALHGAWAAEDNDDADGEIVEALRSKAGKHIPIVITLDSHANVTRRLVDNVDALAGYRTFPHVDYAETGRRAAELLFRIVRGEIRPKLQLRKIPMIVPAENQMTDRGPMAELWREAENGEREGRSLATSLFAVQPWLDVEEMGFSVVTTSENERLAAEEAERLGELAWLKRRDFDVALHSVPQILTMRRQESTKGPFVISDSADSPGAGSPGDSNFVLRELLAHKAGDTMNCLLSIVDPPAAREAFEAGSGSYVKLRVGHRVSADVGSPLAIEGIVTCIGDGRFLFGGGHVANLEANMGKCAVVGIGGISLLVMENPTFTGDPAMYRSMGLEPADADLVLVKSAAQFRAEYEKLTDRIYILDTPGASTANLLRLPFRNVPRPMYPFDDDFREGRVGSDATR